MGTPDFAKTILAALYEKSGAEIVGVVTQPDKPKGRGYVLMPPPVKEYALSVSLPVYQPTTLRTEEFANLLANLAPELIVVAAYGKILPKSVLDFPKYGCVNAHASLLPKFRGAAPIQRAILEGETETGVTAMYMAEGLDTGDMILTERVSITEADNFETLHDKLALAGAAAMLRTVDAIKNGTVTREKQDDALATYAAKIEKADGVIDFSAPVAETARRVRALSPFPLAFAKTPDGKMLKFVAAEATGETTDAEGGTVLSADKTGFTVACGGGVLAVHTVVPEGKGRMAAADFVRGRKIAVGDVLLRGDK